MNAVLKSLPVLVLYPHNRCNCRCVMCDIWKIDTAEEISADELVRHMDDLKALRVEWVVFSGGEPLMHSDLFRLAGLLRENGIRTTVLSTGLLLKRNAARVVETIDDVIVSLDGPADAHDAIRRVPGAFRMLHEGMEALHEIDPSYVVAARCTVQRGNSRGFERPRGRRAKSDCARFHFWRRILLRPRSIVHWHGRWNGKPRWGSTSRRSKLWR
jgi:MoaA/NifB/PqqE/SkfB family radical SAM enzyme